MRRRLNMEVRNKCIEMRTEFRGLYILSSSRNNQWSQIQCHHIVLSDRDCCLISYLSVNLIKLEGVKCVDKNCVCLSWVWLSVPILNLSSFLGSLMSSTKYYQLPCSQWSATSLCWQLLSPTFSSQHSWQKVFTSISGIPVDSRVVPQLKLPVCLRWDAKLLE